MASIEYALACAQELREAAEKSFAGGLRRSFRRAMTKNLLGKVLKTGSIALLSHCPWEQVSAMETAMDHS